MTAEAPAEPADPSQAADGAPLPLPGGDIGALLPPTSAASTPAPAAMVTTVSFRGDPTSRQPIIIAGSLVIGLTVILIAIAAFIFRRRRRAALVAQESKSHKSHKKAASLTLAGEASHEGELVAVSVSQGSSNEGIDKQLRSDSDVAAVEVEADDCMLPGAPRSQVATESAGLVPPSRGVVPAAPQAASGDVLTFEARDLVGGDEESLTSGELGNSSVVRPVPLLPSFLLRCEEGNERRPLYAVQ